MICPRCHGTGKLMLELAGYRYTGNRPAHVYVLYRECNYPGCHAGIVASPAMAYASSRARRENMTEAHEVLKPGWFLHDIQRAAERIEQWEREHPDRREQPSTEKTDG